MLLFFLSSVFSKLNDLSSFSIMTSQTKEFTLTDPRKYLGKKSNIFQMKQEQQFSWYYVHFLTNDISKVREHINIEGEDKLIKNTYVLYLSDTQLYEISNISLVKRIDPEDKLYENDCSIEDTNYLMVITYPGYKLHSKEDIYTVTMQFSENSFIVRINNKDLHENKQKTIKILTKISEVKSIIPFTKPILNNAIGSGYTQRNSNEYKQLPGRGYYYLDRYLNDNGLNGEGEIITIADTIIDFTHSMFRDDNVTVELNQPLPNHRKFVYYGYDYPSTFIDDMFDDEHGTHTAATAAGKSICSIDNENISFFNGIAPESKLLYGGHYLDITPMRLQSLMRTYNSNISTNSWGSRGYHLNYNYQYSRIASYNPQIIFIFSAGNLRIDLGNFSVQDPGGSRDILSVGAIDRFNDNPSYYFVRNDTLEIMFIAERIANTVYPYISGQISSEINKTKFLAIETSSENQCHQVNLSQFVLFYGEDFEWIHKCHYIPKNQVYFTKNKTGVNLILNKDIELATLPKFQMQQEQQIKLAPYSSSGPGYHGILKPDVVAPGTQIISARSQAHSTTSHGCLDNFFNDLKTMDGTSMATPNVAGGAALIHQYFKSGKWIDKIYPNGALTRALIINSCKHPYNSKIPDIFFGHGVVDLSTIIPIKNDFGVKITQEGKNSSVSENGHVFCKLFVNKTNKLIKKLQITLSYLDPILSSDSLIPLNHDLDLVVVSPSKNKIFLGDHLINNDTQHCSTNEKIIINEDEIEDGQYTIHIFGGVFADHVSYGDVMKQDFSVVASGPIENGYLEFEESKECLCDKCDPDHPEICLCDENKNVGPLCQAQIETFVGNKGEFVVGTLQIKRIRFVVNGNITNLTSKSSHPGRDATIWISDKCHLSLGEYEINGQTTNETTEKPIRIQKDSNEICVAIFNNNDMDATYSIEIFTDNDDGGDSSEVTYETSEIIDTTQTEEIIDTTQTEEITQTSEIIDTTQTEEITKTSEIIDTTQTEEITKTSEIIDTTQTEEITKTSEIIGTTQTEEIIDTTQTEEITKTSEIIYSDEISYTNSNSDDDDDGGDTGNNKDKQKKKVIIAVVISLTVVVVAISVFVAIVFIRKSGKCSGNRLDATTSIYSEYLLAKEKI